MIKHLFWNVACFGIRPLTKHYSILQCLDPKIPSWNSNCFDRPKQGGRLLKHFKYRSQQGVANSEEEMFFRKEIADSNYLQLKGGFFIFLDCNWFSSWMKLCQSPVLSDRSLVGGWLTIGALVFVVDTHGCFRRGVASQLVGLPPQQRGTEILGDSDLPVQLHVPTAGVSWRIQVIDWPCQHIPRENDPEVYKKTVLWGIHSISFPLSHEYGRKAIDPESSELEWPCLAEAVFCCGSGLYLYFDVHPSSVGFEK